MGLRICRIVTVVSAVLVLMLVLVLFTSDISGWSNFAANAVKVAVQVLWACFLISPIVAWCLKYQAKSQAASERIAALEREVARLRKER